MTLTTLTVWILLVKWICHLIILHQEVKSEIKMLNIKKSPGYNEIDALVAKSLTKIGILFLTLIFNFNIKTVPLFFSVTMCLNYNGL